MICRKGLAIRRRSARPGARRCAPSSSPRRRRLVDVDCGGVDIAKTTRAALMRNPTRDYRNGFADRVGYAAELHRRALALSGPCPAFLSLSDADLNGADRQELAKPLEEEPLRRFDRTKTTQRQP